MCKSIHSAYSHKSEFSRESCCQEREKSMNIHYYEIKNCYLGESCGQPVIFPPKDTDRKTLTKCGFVQLTDSDEWGHFLSDEEYQYIMQFSKEGDVTFEGDKYDVQNTEIITNIRDKYENSEDNHNRTAGTMAGLSIILMIIAVVGSLVDFFAHFEISLVFGLFFIVSVVSAVALRIKFPENKLGKILIRVYITLALLVVGFLTFVIISCSIAIDSCIDSCCEAAEGCGKIG